MVSIGLSKEGVVVEHETRWGVLYRVVYPWGRYIGFLRRERDFEPRVLAVPNSRRAYANPRARLLFSREHPYEPYKNPTKKGDVVLQRVLIELKPESARRIRGAIIATTRGVFAKYLRTELELRIKGVNRSIYGVPRALFAHIADEVFEKRGFLLKASVQKYAEGEGLSENILKDPSRDPEAYKGTR